MSNFAADLLPLWETVAARGSAAKPAGAQPAPARDPEALCLRLASGQHSGDWSYGYLTERARLFAQLLLHLEVAPGQRVVVQVAKSPDAVALYLATLAIGAVYVPLNVAYTRSEVRYFVADAGACLVVCESHRLAELADVARAVGAQAVTLGEESWTSKAPPVLRTAAGPVAASSTPHEGPIAVRADEDLAVIVYTSGTTGRSKGAMLTHENLRSNAEVLRRAWQISSRDVLVHALPIFHVHGLFVALHPLLLAGASARFLPRFEVSEVRRQLPGATLLMGVPTFYTRLLDEAGFGAEDCASMRLFVSGSAPLLAATHRAFEQRTGHRVLERYGMSETGMIASNPLEGERVAGTVGFALPGVELRVCEPESGRLCGPGEVGVVEVRGANVFAGYWRMPDKTAKEFRADGFFVTGDLGALDEQGRLTLVGRDKDLVISGGYNIYPKEIEEVLDALPGVVESAVIGVPHDDLGEGLVAVLVAAGAPLEREQLETALQSELARFKHPRRFFWIPELPRNAMGKVQKKILREQYAGTYRTSDVASDTSEEAAG